MFLKASLLGGLCSFVSYATANVIQSVEPRAECYNSAPGKTCATHGVLKEPNPLHHTGYSGNINGVATNIVNCWGLSRQFPDRSSSFSWNPKTQSCKLYRTSLTEQKFVKGKSTEIFYDNGCFKCLDTCPRPLGENQFINGGFEMFPHSIYPWNTISPYKIVKPGFNSKQSFGLSRPNYQHNAYQEALVCENEYYIYTLDHKFVYQNKKYGSFSMYFGPMAYSANLPKNNTWGKATMLGTPVAGYQARSFSFAVDPGAKPKAFYIDNVKVYRVKRPQILSNVPDQVSNGGFELGTTKGFNVSDNCSVSPNGFKSDHSLRCEVNQHKDGIGRIMANVGQLAANTPYVFSFDYKFIRDKEAYCYLFLAVGPRLQYEFSHMFHQPKNDTWVNREITFLVDNLDGYVNLRATSPFAGHTCQFYFDNFSVRKASID